MSKLKGFTPCLDTIAERRDLIAAAVYGMVYRFEQGDRAACFASQATIAKRLHVGLATVKRRLQALEQDGYITKSQRKGRTNIYKTTRKAGLNITAVATDELAQNDIPVGQKELTASSQRATKIQDKKQNKRMPNGAEGVRTWTAEKFEEITKLKRPPNKEEVRGSWWIPIQEICDNAQNERSTIELVIRQALSKLGESNPNLIISSPRAILKTTRAVFAELDGGGIRANGQETDNAWRRRVFGENNE